MECITREQIEGMARIYANNTAASKALGAAFLSFNELCQRADVAPPFFRTDRSDRKVLPHRK